jgi:hypothetical protein
MTMPSRVLIGVLVLLLAGGSIAHSQATPFQAFVQNQALELRANDRPAASVDEWNQRRETLRARLLKAWGGFPEIACDLEPRKLGEFQRDGYRVEKIVFQTRLMRIYPIKSKVVFQPFCTFMVTGLVPNKIRWCNRGVSVV